MQLTSRFLEHLLEFGERYTFLLPVLFIFGPIVTLPLDFVYYIYTKNIDKEVSWSNPSISEWHKPFLHVIQPLSNLGKNLLDTFRPYKYNAKFEFIRTFKQPFEGVAFILTGVWRAVTSPLIALGVITLAALSILGDRRKAPDKKELMRKVGVWALSYTFNGIARIAAGAVQFALTPFSWFIKPIIRAGISALEQQAPLIENNRGIERRLEIAATQNGDALRYTCADIHRKFLKCKERREYSHINMELENATYANAKVDNYAQYLKLFPKPAIDPRRIVPAEDLDIDEPGANPEPLHDGATLPSAP